MPWPEFSCIKFGLGHIAPDHEINLKIVDLESCEDALKECNEMDFAIIGGEIAVVSDIRDHDADTSIMSEVRWRKADVLYHTAIFESLSESHDLKTFDLKFVEEVFRDPLSAVLA